MLLLWQLLRYFDHHMSGQDISGHKQADIKTTQGQRKIKKSNQVG